eukprot:6701598-Prymnesium_polylepis.1
MHGRGCHAPNRHAPRGFHWSRWNPGEQPMADPPADEFVDAAARLRCSESSSGAASAFCLWCCRHATASA